jgi:hypothetical protein
MAIKKTCNGCKALVYETGSKVGTMYCQLGYGTKDKKILFGVVVETCPTEVCPKPKTNSDLILFSK